MIKNPLVGHIGMSNYHCYLCASDDGIQLDIFGVGGKAICEKIESCLSVKIEESNALATKICHKCAFELDACSKFVAKYRQSRDSTKGKSNPIKGHCSLCSEPGKIGYIFDCKDGNPANDTLHKIQEIFNDSIFNDKRRTLSICLDCRYNLDVLFDLKCIYQSTPDKLRHLSEKGLRLSELPKTKTRVVKRKTTFIPVPRLNGNEVYDSDSTSVTSIMPYKRKRGRPRKDSEPISPAIFRTCEQCETNVQNGLDMYRYHRTGITVCKECWLAMDPEKLTQSKRKKLGIASGEIGTRRCAIILKDVLTNPAKYETIYKVEKDEHGNTTFIVTDDSSENEEREKTPAKKSRRSHGSVASVDDTPVKRIRPPKRTASTKSTDLDDEPPVKLRDKGKNIEEDSKPPMKLRDKGKNTEDDSKPPVKLRDKGKNTEDDSKPPVKLRDKGKNTEDDSKPPEKVRDKGKNTEDNVKTVKIKDKLKKIHQEQPSTSTNIRTKNGLAISDTEVFESRTRRRFNRQSTDSEKDAKAASDAELAKPPAKKREARTKLHKIPPVDLSSNKTKTAVTKGRKTGKNAAPVVSTTETNERPVRRTRAQSFSSPDATSLANTSSNVSRNTKSFSETESPSLKTRKINNKSVSPKNSVTELEIENPYTCSVCHLEYSNKVIRLEHEITHAKQPELKLQRVAIPEIIVEEAPEESSLIEEPEEQSHDVSSTSENRPGDSENIETSVPVISHEEASTEVFAETNDNDENAENFEKNINSPEVVETTSKVDDKQEEEKNQIEDKTLENKDKVEDKTDDNENKDKDNVEETNKITESKAEETEDKNEEKTEETEVKNEDKTEETEDKNLNETEETEDKNLNETEETEDENVDETEITENKNENESEITENKSIDQTEKAEDQNEDETEETQDKNEDKTEKKEDETDDKIENKTDETEGEIEDQTETTETTETETTVENKIVDENNIESTRQVETNDNLTIAESDKNNDDEKTEITEENAADSVEPESTLSEEVDEVVEITEPLEKLSEHVSDESAEISENLNGVDVQDDANSEVNNVAEVEKDSVTMNSNAESEAVDYHSREKSVESDNAPPVTSTSPEKNNEVQDVVTDKVCLNDDDTINELEAGTQADTTEASIFPENNVTKDSEGSESIVSDVLTEVFDLATAEVQKRMDNEPSRDEKCTTPVSETLENISREISNSADMPSLEPLVDNQSSNIQS